MTIQKVILFAGLIICAYGHDIAAQTRLRVPVYPFQPFRDSILKGTQLGPRQAAQVDSIAAAYLDRMHALDPVMRTKNLTARRQNLLELQVEQGKDIIKLLTPQQRAIFDKNYAAWARRHNITG